jgi:tripartite-type tricarboxylate transporter receptor subunit TctC
MKQHLKAAAVAAAILSLAPAAEAAWPNDKPIEIIVGFAAGGGTDIMARTLAPFLEKYLKASVVVVNRGGAGGELAWTALAQAKPDGYTIGFINTPNVLTIPIERKARFSLDDFKPIANMVDDPTAFNVHVDTPIKDLKELIAYAKANPGAVTVGTSGVGSDDHLAMLALERASGIKMTHVPFAGSAPTRTALLGRHITIGSVNLGEVTSYTGDAGRIRIIGHMAADRWAGNPSAPTFREQGIDIVMGSQRGLGAPKGLPPEILDRIVKAVQQTVEDPEFQEKAKQQYLPLAYEPSASWEASLRAQQKAFADLWASSPWAQK